MPEPHIHLLCNAHLDPVWLWEWEEGAAEALSTFRTAADLLAGLPALMVRLLDAALTPRLAMWRAAGEAEPGAAAFEALAAARTRLLELGGASAASRQRNLDRHWRNIRTLAANLIGGYLVGVCVAVFQALPQLDPAWRLALSRVPREPLVPRVPRKPPSA